VEQLGNGIPKIVNKYGREAISVDGFIIQTTLKFDTKFNDDINDGNLELENETNLKTRNKIIAEIKRNPSGTMNELANVIGISAAGIRWQLENLKSMGIIRRIGSKKNGHWEIIK